MIRERDERAWARVEARIEDAIERHSGMTPEVRRSIMRAAEHFPDLDVSRRIIASRLRSS